jgi:hypothetical protein
VAPLAAHVDSVSDAAQLTASMQAVVKISPGACSLLFAFSWFMDGRFTCSHKILVL